MVDAGFALSKAYVALLAGLAYNGVPVPLYDIYAPDDAVAPYVILAGWTPRPDNTKDGFGQTGQFVLDVVTRFVGDSYSTKPATDIANLITALLKPTPIAEPLIVDGFRVWLTVIETRPLGAPAAAIRHFGK